MGQLGRDIKRRKLERLLARSDDEGVIGLVSAVVALQDGNPAPRRLVTDYPPGAVGAALGSNYHLAPWTLEVLVNELLYTPKDRHFGQGRTRTVDHTKFQSLRAFANLIIQLENVEDGIFLENHDVFYEMARIAQRQFPWQRGTLNAPLLYRSLLLYGSDGAAEFFQAKYGIGVSDFILVGMWFGAALSKSGWADRFMSMAEVSIASGTRDAALGILSIEHQAARKYARKIRSNNLHTAYKRSILRDYPIIGFGPRGERLRAPIPELIMQRCTSGLYLDVVGGGAAVWTEIGKRFEQYCHDYLTAMMAGFEVEGEQVYGPKKARYRTPDVLVSKGGALTLVAECKAKRMTFEARFADDPVSEATFGFDELAKGVFQLWRFFAHARRGLYGAIPVQPDCQGAIITADSWLTMARNQVKQVYDAAHLLADKEGDVLTEDRRPIAFCFIDDVEYALQRGTGDSFLTACRDVSSGEKNGFMLSIAHNDEGAPDRGYPFRDKIGDHLSWWQAMSDKS